MNKLNEWESQLNGRLSKIEVKSHAQRLHHDEQGIASLLQTMLTSKDKRVVANTAWILFHLAKTDKEIYLFSSYDKIVDFVMLPNLSIRRGLVLSILYDMPIKTNFRTDLLDFCLSGMLDKKESDSTRSIMIKFAAKVCSPFPELANEIKPSISCASKNALNYLSKSSYSRKTLR